MGTISQPKSKFKATAIFFFRISMLGGLVHIERFGHCFEVTKQEEYDPLVGAQGAYAKKSREIWRLVHFGFSVYSMQLLLIIFFSRHTFWYICTKFIS